MAGSVLDQIKNRRGELLAAAESKEIPIPGWTRPSFALRVHPIPYEMIRRFGARAEKARGDTKPVAELTSAAAIVEAATDEVLIGEGDGRVELGLNDPQLLEALDLPADAKPLTILRALCLDKDGVLLNLSVAVQRHSGYLEAEADEDLAGE